ncbi:hypothetical protein COCON_G00232250, partial [Conger conger]
ATKENDTPGGKEEKRKGDYYSPPPSQYKRLTRARIVLQGGLGETQNSQLAYNFHLGPTLFNRKQAMEVSLQRQIQLTIVPYSCFPVDDRTQGGMLGDAGIAVVFARHRMSRTTSSAAGGRKGRRRWPSPSVTNQAKEKRLSLCRRQEKAAGSVGTNNNLQRQSLCLRTLHTDYTDI